MFPNRTISSGDGSFPSSGELGRNSSMPSLKGRPLMHSPHKSPRFPPHFAPPCNPHIFDAAKFVCDKVPVPIQRTRYLDREREKHVTTWLMEAQEALEKIEKKKKPSTKKKPFLRRFHSQESNKDFITNPFDSSWNENFILSDGSNPKKTKALLKRFQSTTHDNFDGGTDSKNDTYERNESTGSRRGRESPSPQSTGAGSKKITPREFLDKYTLPRVAMLEGEDQPLLLYKHIPNYTRVEAVRLIGKKGKPVGKPIYIPEGYQGWFALVNERGTTNARSYSTIADLIKAHVTYFLAAAPLAAYLLQRDSESDTFRYVKGSARAGTPLRLSGVFEDARSHAHSPVRPTSPAGGESTAQRYAQLIDPNMTEMYAPLTAKGEFYPVGLTAGEGGLCRLSGGLLGRSLPLRVRLVAGPAPPAPLQPTLTSGTLLLRAVTSESVVVMCSLPETARIPMLTLLSLNADKKLQRTHLGFESEKRMFLSSRLHKAITYCQMNVDSWLRQITFAFPQHSPIEDIRDKMQPKKQDVLDEDIVNDVTPRRSQTDIAQIGQQNKEKKFTFQGLKVDASRLFGKSDKILKDIPDENEGSIIFISKNELEQMILDVYHEDDDKRPAKVEDENHNKTKSQNFNDEKMKVFRENNSHEPKLTKWFKQLKLLRSTERLTDGNKNDEIKAEKYKGYGDPFDPFNERSNSMERYQDMSKLIEDRFGASKLNSKKDGLASGKWQSYRSLTTSSDIGVSTGVPKVEPKRVLTKSVSVQTGIMDTDDTISELGQKKNLSVEQLNYYSENDSSLKKRQIYSGNCARRLEIEMGRQKLSRFERRQRIRPDLIPERSDIASSSSYDQIQSCEDLNVYGSESVERDKTNKLNNQSFITEKLCSEFHVKTKRVLSKSTSNLINGKDKKDTTNKTSMSKKNLNSIENEYVSNIIEETRNEEKMKKAISAIQNRKLPVIEDLPYGQVADAIKGRGNVERRGSDNSDNIYAEICSPEIKKIDEEEDLINFKKELLQDTSFVTIDFDSNQPIQIKTEPTFRHMEVIVIERNHNQDDNSVDSDFVDSDTDEKISENISQKYSSLSGSGGFSAGNSLEKDNKSVSNIFSSSEMNHAIRLEVTHGTMYDSEISKSSLDSRDAKVTKNESYIKYSQDLMINEDDIINCEKVESEAIYSTLK